MFRETRLSVESERLSELLRPSHAPVVVTAAASVEVIMHPNAVLTLSVGVLNITCQNGLSNDWQVGEKELAPWGLYNEMSLWPWLHYSVPNGSGT